MKTFMAMLALVVGLTFGAATFVKADEKAAPAPAPAPAGEMKKEEGKKDEGKKAEKKGKKAEKK